MKQPQLKKTHDLFRIYFGKGMLIFKVEEWGREWGWEWGWGWDWGWGNKIEKKRLRRKDW